MIRHIVKARKQALGMSEIHQRYTRKISVATNTRKRLNMPHNKYRDRLSITRASILKSHPEANMVPNIQDR